jgi:hypothetical protein
MWLFLGLAGFFLVTGGIYVFTAGDPTGAAVLGFSLLMCALVAVYLRVSAGRTRLSADEPDATPEGATGLIGFFSPFSYWPAALAVSAGLLLLGPILSLWLVLIGGLGVASTVIGLVFQHPPSDSQSGRWHGGLGRASVAPVEPSRDTGMTAAGLPGAGPAGGEPGAADSDGGPPQARPAPGPPSAAPRLVFAIALGGVAAVFFGIDAAYVTSGALSVAFVLAGAVFVFGALVALLLGGSR